MINTLLNPFIIYWDLPPDETDKLFNARICEELVRARIFVLNLRDTSGKVSAAAMDILARLAGNQPRINLTVMARCLLEQSTADILGGNAARVYIEFISADDLFASAGALKDLREKGIDTGLSFYLARENWKDVPAVINFCRENEIRELKLPIQRADEEVFYFSRDEIRWLSGELKGIDISTIKLVIHDPFLWEMFHGRENPNEEGCNAARTMMYIDKNYDVSPCPIMPVSMGNLHNSSLNGIFVSEKRMQVRKDLAAAPLDCTTCPKAPVCKGGCRGRTFVLFKDYNRRDPACPLE